MRGPNPGWINRVPGGGGNYAGKTKGENPRQNLGKP